MMMEEAPPPGAAAFQSVEECVQALPAILDGGGAARTDAYAFLYSRLEAAAGQEETPAELRGVVGAQHGPVLVQHILQAIQAAVNSPLEHAGHTNVCLPLLTVLLSHECCCRALDASNSGTGASGGVKVLGKLVDMLLEGQRRLAKTAAPTSPPPQAAASAGASRPTASQEARVACLPLVDVCYNLLETLAYQRCDLSRSPDAFLDRLIQALQLAVDGQFGALAPSLPEQGLHAATRLLPRLQPLPGAAAKCRPLLKAVLRRALTVLSTTEATVAVDVLRWAMQVQPTPLLSRDAPDEEDGDGGASGRGRESYHACILKHVDDAKPLDRLAEADPTAALRLAGLLVRLLNPIDVKTQLVMHKLWPITHRFLLDKDVEVAARLEALFVWADYVEALSQFWPLIARDSPAGAGKSAQHKRWQRRKQTFGAVVSFLGKSLVHLFKQQLSQPSEQTLQLESHALALLNTLLSEAAWREWLWQPPSLGGGAAGQQQRQQAGGEGQREQNGGGGLLQPVVLRLLGTRHDGTEGDLGTLRFDAGLACLAELVPGALPRELLLRDRVLRGWRRVAPLDAASQRALLTAAIAELASQRVVRRFLEEQQRQQQAAALAAQAQATQSQMEVEVDAAAAVVTPQPRALQALLASWSHLLLRLLPAALAGHADDTAATAAIVDGTLEVLRQRQGSKRPQFVAHKLADEALRLLGPSEAAIPRGSGLWRDVQERVYKQPPESASASVSITTQPLRLGALTLGLKALLIRQDGNEHLRGVGSTPTDPSATALALGGGDSPLLPLPIPQLVAFLEGMLARCVDPDGGVATPRPFLRLYYAALARLLELLAPQARPTDKQMHALALAVLRLLPAFAAQGAVHVASVIPTAEAFKAEAGGPLLEQWANLFARCLARAEAPPGRSTGSSQSQSQMAQWAVEDPAEAVAAVADAVLSPLLAPPQSSKAMAALWLPLAHHALRGVNTALNSSGSGGAGGNTEGQRVRAALFTPALRLATALLKVLHSVTAPGSSDLAVCVCDTCSAGLRPSSSSSSGAPTATRGQTWLGACLRPCLTAEEWRLEQVKELAEVLAAWWGPAAAAAVAEGGEGGAAEATVVPPCRVALAKDAARIADRFLDGIVAKSSTRRSSGSLGGSGAGSRGVLRPPAAPSKALEALRPLLLALLTHGGEEGKTRVQALWQGAELGKRTDLGLGVDGMKTQALCRALQQLVRSGAIASLDPALSKGSSGGGAGASNGGGGGGGGRRPSSSSSSSSKSESPVVRKRPSSSGSANGGGGGGAGTPGSSGAAAKRTKG